MEKNRVLVRRLEEIAESEFITPGKLALAWLLAQGDDIVPIPGTKMPRYVQANVEAANVRLTRHEISRINQAVPRGAAAGLRYPEESMGSLGL